MTRYFFHIQDGVRYEDETGTELPDLTAVRKRALKVCGHAGERHASGSMERTRVADDRRR
jgi:hypothetical protein